MWNRGWLLWAWNDNRYIIVVHQIRERYAAIRPYMPHLCVLECRSTTTATKNGVWKRSQKSNIGNSLRWNRVGSRHFVDATINHDYSIYNQLYILCFVFRSELKVGGKLEITGFLLSVTRDNKSSSFREKWTWICVEICVPESETTFSRGFSFFYNFVNFFLFLLSSPNVASDHCQKPSETSAGISLDRIFQKIIRLYYTHTHTHSGILWTWFIFQRIFYQLVKE
jgi:hypothetical protein